MRERFTSIIQKTAVLFLTFLLFLTMVPVGLFSGSDSPSAEGSFMREFPIEEVSAQTVNSDETIRNIGRYNSVYYKFDVSELTKVKEDEIKEVKLRLTFLKGSGEINNTVKISVVDAERMPEKPEEISVLPIDETAFMRIRPDTSGNEDVVEEIDMTEYVKAALKNEKTEIAVSISGGMSVCVSMASQKHLDAAYRPCLKMVTGIARDTDAATAAKTELKDVACVSADNRGATGENIMANEKGLTVGGGYETYLKFDINRAAIMGKLYSARLILKNDNKENDTYAKVYLLNNSQWTANEISFDNKPRGEETETATVIEKGADVITVDVTQQVCEAFENKIDTITFRIEGSSNVVKFESGENDTQAPKLYLKASDDKNIVCASEAALNALGNNRASFVTMKLLESYLSQNGVSAKIDWNEIDANNNLLKDAVCIFKNGTVTRPGWYEAAARVAVNAKISSGEYITNRRYYLTIPAESAPDYSKYKFSNYIDVGAIQSEKSQKVEYKNMSHGRKKWLNGQLFSYRTPEEGAIMLFNFSCSPYETNYLTLKLWAEDAASPNKLCIIPCGYAGEEECYAIPSEAKNSGDGFIYVTYALPKSFTEGKNSVSLRLSFDEYTEKFKRAVYAAYLTQNLFFEPEQFAKQGEKSIGAESFADKAISKFIDNIKLLFSVSNTYENKTSSTETENVVIDNAGAIIFTGKDINIAFNINSDKKTASIYQRTKYFDRYCTECPVNDDKGIVSIEFGPYILLWNRTETEFGADDLKKEFSGIYKEIPSNVYYNFSKEGELADDSVVPADRTAIDGKEMRVKPDSAVILRHISHPISSADWRISTINGRNVSEIAFDATEKINELNVKAVGGVSENSEKLTALLMLYDDGKIISVKKSETDLYADVHNYSIDLSDEHIYMKKGRELKVFVYDDTEDVGKVLPKIKLPQTNK